MLYILTVALLSIGIFGLFTQRNLVKLIISLSIVEGASNIFLILVGYRSSGVAPIITRKTGENFVNKAVDPFPQAMILTSIVIGLSLLALMTAIALRLYHIYGTYNLDEIMRLQKEKEK